MFFPTPVLQLQLRSADRSYGERSGVRSWFQRMRDLPLHLRLRSHPHLGEQIEVCGCFATTLGEGLWDKLQCALVR